MKYFIIAGEASGDMHASNLIKELRARDESAEIMGIGGDRMQSLGVDLKYHYKDIAYMGFVEVVFHLRVILQAIKKCKESILDFQPDALILVDYPGFNLRIAEWAKKMISAKVFYYISPQVWAWKASRTHKIKAFTDELYCILPFEPSFFEKYDFDVKYVGHPLLDELENFAPDNEALTNAGIRVDESILILMPGSRKQEIERMLPVMMEATEDLSDYQRVVACAPGQDISFYQEVLGDQDVMLVKDATYSLLHHADMAIVTSGTATLETALFGVPQVVCYKGSNISYQIARRLVKLKFISLVNLILDREVIKELIQKEMNAENLRQAINALAVKANQESLLSGYADLRSILSKAGASGMVAEDIVRRTRTN